MNISSPDRTVSIKQEPEDHLKQEPEDHMDPSKFQAISLYLLYWLKWAGTEGVKMNPYEWVMDFSINNVTAWMHGPLH